MGTSTAIEMAAEIIAAFVANNPLPRTELPALIQALHMTVARLEGGPKSAPAPIEPKTPAVPIRRSITPEFLICLEDGKRFKSMRRHLAGLGLTPDQYREKWNLPADYPMVAPNYAAQRSAMAKEIGLGRTHPARISQVIGIPHSSVAHAARSRSSRGALRPHLQSCSKPILPSAPFFQTYQT